MPAKVRTEHVCLQRTGLFAFSVVFFSAKKVNFQGSASGKVELIKLIVPHYALNIKIKGFM